MGCDHRLVSDDALLSAMKRIDLNKEEMSGHGFRAIARKVFDEVLKFRPGYI